MDKAFVVYDSKYGNTKLVAESILEGIRKVKGFEATIRYAKDINNIRNVPDFDLIVIGGPNHMGRPSRTIKKFVNRLAELDLKSKNVAVFGTYSGKIRTVDRAVKKLTKMIETKLPNLNIVSPSISIRVNKIRGPIIEGELPKCVDFGKKIASQFRIQ